MRLTREMFVYSFVAVLLAARVAAAQPAGELSGLGRIVDEELRALNVPGAAIAVVQDGRIVYERGFGVADTETGAPVTPEMLFRIGSTTKMFTAAAVVARVGQDGFTLDEPVGRWAGGLHPALAGLTVDQLLSHRAGFIDDAPMYGLHDDTALAARVTGWDRSRLFLEPGAAYSYANPGYWLAGYALEQIAGRPFATHMQDALLRPLGMVRSTFDPLVAMTYPLALGHNAGRDEVATVARPFADDAATRPAGSLFSNVRELSRFAIALMDGGRINNAQVLPAAVVHALTSVHAEVPDAGIRYGYGLNLDAVRGVRVWQHEGSRLGYGSSIRMFPDQRVAIVVLTNRTGAALERSVNAIMDALLPVAATVSIPQVVVPMSTAEMQRYVGTYAQGLTEMRVVLDGNQLGVAQGSSTLPIGKVGEGRFAILVGGTPSPVSFSIVAGRDGEPEYFYRGDRALRRQR